MSYLQIIDFPEIFKDFFACKIVLASNRHYPGNSQRLFLVQKCLSRKSSISRFIQRLCRLQMCLRRQSSISRIYSVDFSTKNFSQLQVIIIPELFKDFFWLPIVSAANHQSHGNTKSFSIAKLS